MAMDQVSWLCKQDPETVLTQVKDIVEHNYHVMIERDWYGEFSSLLDQEIRPLLQDLNLREV
jgi:hypothetical protein